MFTGSLQGQKRYNRYRGVFWSLEFKQELKYNNIIRFKDGLVCVHI